MGEKYANNKNKIKLYKLQRRNNGYRIICFLRNRIKISCTKWAFVRANYLPLIFSTKEVLILPVSKHRHKDNDIYERDHNNGKAACAYKHYTQ